MRMVRVVCDYCKKEISKPKNEYNRRLRLGKDKFYCNNQCSGHIQDNITRINSYEDRYDIGQYSSNRKDEFSLFRWYMKVMKNPDRKFVNFDIDLQYLKDLWESQSGICPISGIQMELRTHSNCNKFLADPNTASIDRIDNSIGYVKGNIRFITNMANMARNKFSDEQLIYFCRKVTDFQQEKNDVTKK